MIASIFLGSTVVDKILVFNINLINSEYFSRE